MQKKLDIIYEDKSILVVNKPVHLLTIATEKEKENTLYHKVYEYVHKKSKRNRIFIVHRLDKDTSGIVVFAKSEEIKQTLQRNWDKYASVREYYAIVEGNVKSDGTNVDYLKETKTLKTIVTDKEDGKKAITHYHVLYASKQYSILSVHIETGRKNQIRVSLSNMGHPIIGDKKYGATKNPLRRICLHANYLELIHPKTREVMQFKAKIPSEFKIYEKR